MLDLTDFESWSTTYTSVLSRKDNGENIMNIVPLKERTFQNGNLVPQMLLLLEESEGEVHQGPIGIQRHFLTHQSPILTLKSLGNNVKMILEGYELLKDATRESQLYDELNTSVTIVDDDVDDSQEMIWALNVVHNFEADEYDAFYLISYGLSIMMYNEMQNDRTTQITLLTSDADYTSDSNIFRMFSMWKDNVEHVASLYASSVRIDALMSILRKCMKRYKELVGEYEKRAKFELTDRERKIDEQMRIIISDRNRKETSLKSELHSAQILLSSTVDHYKSKTEEVTLLKKDFKQKEDKFLEEFLDLKKLKDKIEDRLYKQDQSVQTVHMLCKPKSFYDEKHKVAIGYKNPVCLARAKQAQSALYNGHVLVTTNHTPTVIHDSEDTRELAEITRNRMLLKMQSPLCVENKVRIAPPDYSKENFLATFAPQRNLTPEQIFWSIDDNNRKKAETLAPKPISALTVYPPNTPVKLVPRILPTKSQVKINLYVLTQLFTEFDKTCKTRITPTALFKEVKEMEEIFDQMNNEVDKNTVDKQCAEIEKKNLLIENENLIVNCLSTQLLYDVEKSRCLDLEADMSKVHDESKLISKLEREYLNLQLKYQHLQESFDNKNSQASQEAPDFNSFFKIKNLEHQIQEKDNVIRHLKDLVANVNDRSRVNDSTQAADQSLRRQYKEKWILPAKRRIRRKYHGMCVVNILNSVNATSTVTTVLNKGKQIWETIADDLITVCTRTKRVWKATGKLFADIGYQWRPTGKKLSLGKLDCGSQWRPTGKKFALGEMCHLTKLSVKCSTLYANQQDPNKNWGTEIPNSPNSTVFKCRSYRSCFGIWTQAVQNFLTGNRVMEDYGQFCDSDLEVAFRKHTCFVRDIKGTDILKGSRGTNLYTISIDEMMKSSPICLLSKASKSKSWLWHRRLNHLNFGTINDLARKDLVRGLPRLKFEKDHLCSAVSLDKSKEGFSHRPKSEITYGSSSSLHNGSDAPSTSGFIVTFDIHLPVQHQEIAEEPIHEDTLIIHDVLHPSHNLVTGDPGLAQSSSGNVNSAEPNQVNYPPDHLRRWTKDHPLGYNIVQSLLVLSVSCKRISWRKYCFEESFAPVARIEAQNIHCNAANQRIWLIYRWIQTLPFLNGDLQEEVFVSQPEGFEDQENPTHVYRLKKALYGLKQAPRAWYDTLSKFLLANNFFKGAVDPTTSGDSQLIKLDSEGCVGSLCTLQPVDPDLVFAFDVCYRYQLSLPKALEAIKRCLFGNCKETINMGIWYPKDNAMSLTAYADADHAGCQDSRRSTSGSAQFLGDRLVSWSSKKQRSTAISTTEAEYIAMSGCCAQILEYAIPAQRLPDLTSIKFLCTVIKSAIALCCNNVLHLGSKHIDIRGPFIQRASGIRVLNSPFFFYTVETNYQLADILTKALPRERFEFLLPRLGMKSLTPETLRRLQEGEDE
ncbi:retrovirus-related pol polyprotein from transposon TNT 1-94 [Tanacetum coccineum]